MSLADIATLDDYLTKFAPLLGARAEALLDPLHVPGRDAPDPSLGALLRTPFEAQAHVVTAAARALDRQKSAWLICEQGTGKSLMACAAVHAHARGKPYRAVVMCPDHLIAKWGREVSVAVPGASVRRVGNWRDVLALVGRRSERPAGPEWTILGRDASKLDPAWRPAFVRRLRGVCREEYVEGRRARTTHKGSILACPACGADLIDSKGVPAAEDWLAGSKRTCAAMIPGADPDGPGRACGAPLWQFVADRTPAHRGRRVEAARAGRESEGVLADPAAKVTIPNHPYRWAPARLIQRKLKGYYRYCIIDECHEEKSATASQAVAAGKIGSACRKALILTGTLFGGYAWHVFPLLYRFSPRSVVEEGIPWGKEMAWSERYGRIEETVVTREKDAPRGRSHSRSMGSQDVRRRKAVRPGVMPELFGRHLLGQAVFLSLDEVSAALPPRPADEVVPVEMPADLARGYESLEATIRSVIAPMIVRGDTSLLSKMLQTLLAYPDRPWGWGESGYLRDFGIDEPPDLDPAEVRPKEAALVDLVKAEARAGRQCWVYVQMTGVRDVADRLRGLLRDAGLRAEVLRRSVDRREREEWIARRGPGLDACISHPKLVETGLDLFRIDPGGGGHNFATIVFHQAGYNTFTLRQAAHRAWRIGQPLDCRCLYLYYAGTMQERAMELMGRKVLASEAMDGKFSAEGLAALAGDESAELALARGLSDRVRSAARAWGRGAAVRRAPIPPVDITPAPCPGPEPVSPALLGPYAPDVAARKGPRGRRTLPGQMSLFGD